MKPLDKARATHAKATRAYSNTIHKTIKLEHELRQARKAEKEAYDSFAEAEARLDDEFFKDFWGKVAERKGPDK